LATHSSEFDEIFVGTGAKRVRELFAAARKKQPAIIFIDELDAIGSKRSAKDQHYMKQTLNQLLVELDGFKESGKNKARNSGALFTFSDRGNYCHCRYQLPGVARQVRGFNVVVRCNRANLYRFSALVRPGRFDKKVVVPLPDVKGRAQILAHHMRDILSDVGT
jgi:ATP-dependent metalloprotease